MLNRTRTRIAWTASLLALFLLPGLASAQEVDKQETKCANSVNKGAAKVAKAQTKVIKGCFKAGGAVEACILTDPDGKVAKAISKIKTSDCTGGAAPDFLPDLETSQSAIGDIMIQKDLDLTHDIFGIFGGDLDDSIVTKADDKDGNKCQATVQKNAGKCQDEKLKIFNKCKKNALKAGNTDILACMGGTGTGGIPDPDGKITKKCGGDFGLAKKCSLPNVDALIPGCAPGVTADCIDQKIECRVCLALNALDGLNRDCDLFDNGVADGSCGLLSCQHNVETFCVGGDNDGEACESFADCDPQVGPNKCLPISSARLESITAGSEPFGLLFALIGGSTFDVGEIDPNTGTASVACDLTEPIALLIPGLVVACLTPLGTGCDPGLIDCDGGTALDLDSVHHHSIDELMLPGDNEDPSLAAAWQAAEPNFVGADCRGSDTACFTTDDPNCTAHETCAAMCDVYCASLAGNYTVFESGCEGFCRGGINANQLCTLDTKCGSVEIGVENSGECIGGEPVAHAGGCTCDCLEVGSGGPSPAGSFWCQVAIRTVTESITGNLCDGQDIVTIIGEQCIVRTTESITNTVLFADDDPGQTINQFDEGSRISCDALLAGNLSGLTQAGNNTSFDGDLGDSATRTVQECE